MVTLADFELGDRIHSRAATCVHRATRRDGTPVIVKLLTEEYPTERTLAGIGPSLP